MHHRFFIYSSVDGHLGCSDVLAIVNIVTMNTTYASFWIVVVFSGYMSSSGIYQAVSFSFVLKGFSIPFSQVAISIYIPINTGGGLPFFHIFFSTIVCRFFKWWWFWLVWGNTSRFTLNIPYSMGSYTCIMMYGLCYIIVQRIFSTLNPSVIHLFILPLIPGMG